MIAFLFLFIHVLARNILHLPLIVFFGSIDEVAYYNVQSVDDVLLSYVPLLSAKSNEFCSFGWFDNVPFAIHFAPQRVFLYNSAFQCLGLEYHIVTKSNFDSDISFTTQLNWLKWSTIFQHKIFGYYFCHECPCHMQSFQFLR